MLSLGQAARATGRSKPTIARAIKSGKLSAVRGADGSYSIDPAELARVYPVTGIDTGTMTRSEPGNDTGHGSEHRARLVEEQAETIRDLRARLDRAEEERHQLQVQLTALLTDQRGTVARRAWWRWR